MPAPFEIRRVTIDSSSWTPLIAPFNCSRVMLRTADLSNDVKIRTTDTDANTEETIPAGVYFRLDGETPEFIWRNNQSRSIHLWETGDVICYLQATAGTGPVVAGFKQ